MEELWTQQQKLQQPVAEVVVRRAEDPGPHPLRSRLCTWVEDCRDQQTGYLPFHLLQPLPFLMEQGGALLRKLEPVVEVPEEELPVSAADLVGPSGSLLDQRALLPKTWVSLGLELL